MKTIYVFISSTFLDMQEERNYLVRHIFPELKNKCEKFGLRLIDVDLRWGITEKEAEEGRTLEICLEEIDRCQPYFIGILGERYGWTDYSIPTSPKFRWILNHEKQKSITDLEIQYGALKKNNKKSNTSFFYFRNPDFIEQIPMPYQSTFKSESAEAKQMINTVKSQIFEQDFKTYTYQCEFDYVDGEGYVHLKNLDDFGTKVMTDLWDSIQENYINDDGVIEKEKRNDQKLFIIKRAAIFEAREELLLQFKNQIKTSKKKITVLQGEAGTGKTSLLSNFIKKYNDSMTETLFLYHFIGASPFSTNTNTFITNFCKQLCHELNEEFSLPSSVDQMANYFVQFLSRVSENRPIIIVLDAINQLQTAKDFEVITWVMKQLPDHTRLITSMIKDEFIGQKLSIYNPVIIDMPLLSKDESIQIVQSLLKHFRKPLTNNQLSRLLQKEDARKPLYLTIASEELRILGHLKDVDTKIDELGETIPELFEQLIARLEIDFQKYGENLVSSLLSFMAISRIGITESELLYLLRRKDEIKLPWSIWARIYSTIKSYLQPIDENGEGILDFFHEQLKVAVKNRYFTNHLKADYHQRIADYYFLNVCEGKHLDVRSYREVIHHLLAANLFEKVFYLLTNLDFIKNRCMVGNIYEFLEDYRHALSSGGFSDVEHQTIREFFLFIKYYLNVIQKNPNQIFQLAFELGPKSYVKRMAMKSKYKPKAWLTWINKEHFSYEQILKDYTVHFSIENDFINDFSVSPDGRLVGAIDGLFVYIFDSKTGKLQKKLHENADSYKICSFSPAGKWFVIGSEKMIKIFDTSNFNEKGSYSYTPYNGLEIPKKSPIEVSDLYLNRFSFSSDDRYFIWPDNTIKILNMFNFQSATLPYKSNCVKFTPNEQYITSSYQDKLYIIDADSKQLNFSFNHENITAFAISPNSKHALTGNFYISDFYPYYLGTMKLWDIEKGKEDDRFEYDYTEKHGGIKNLVISGDGESVLIAPFVITEDIELAYLKTGQEIRIFDVPPNSFEQTEFSIDNDNSFLVSKTGKDALVGSRRDHSLTMIYDFEKGSDCDVALNYKPIPISYPGGKQILYLIDKKEEPTDIRKLFFNYQGFYYDRKRETPFIKANKKNTRYVVYNNDYFFQVYCGVTGNILYTSDYNEKNVIGKKLILEKDLIIFLDDTGRLHEINMITKKVLREFSLPNYFPLSEKDKDAVYIPRNSNRIYIVGYEYIYVFNINKWSLDFMIERKFIENQLSNTINKSIILKEIGNEIHVTNKPDFNNHQETVRFNLSGRYIGKLSNQNNSRLNENTEINSKRTLKKFDYQTYALIDHISDKEIKRYKWEKDYKVGIKIIYNTDSFGVNMIDNTIHVFSAKTGEVVAIFSDISSYDISPVNNYIAYLTKQLDYLIVIDLDNLNEISRYYFEPAYRGKYVDGATGVNRICWQYNGKGIIVNDMLFNIFYKNIDLYGKF